VFKKRFTSVELVTWKKCPIIYRLKFRGFFRVYWSLYSVM